MLKELTNRVSKLVSDIMKMDHKSKLCPCYKKGLCSHGEHGQFTAKGRVCYLTAGAPENAKLCVGRYPDDLLENTREVW